MDSTCDFQSFKFTSRSVLLHIYLLHYVFARIGARLLSTSECLNLHEYIMCSIILT